MIRCVLVDDEPPARERLRHLLGKTSVLVEIVGEAGSGGEAVPLIHERKPDVVFLDVQMPVMDGFDVVDLLSLPRPSIVFVTAYDQYALRAFEVHALDYLTKPVRIERLNRTLERLAQQRPAATDRSAAGIEALRRGRPLHRLTVHVGPRLRVAQLSEIHWIEADEKTVFAHLKEGRFRTDFTLDHLEARLDPDRFIRIHRSYLINTGVVRELLPWFAGGYEVKLADGSQLPVARRRVHALKQILGTR